MRTALNTPFGVGAEPAPGHGDRHIITTHFPTWNHILRFVDRDPAIMKGFTNMYPRVIQQKDVKQLVQVLLEKAGVSGHACMIFPDQSSALECVQYATAAERNDQRLSPDDLAVRVFDIQHRFWTVFFALEKTLDVIAFWMNPGVGISTRLAEEALKHIDSCKEIPFEDAAASPSHVQCEDAVYEQLRRRIVHHLYRAPLDRQRKQADSSDVYLYQTGMAAIYNLHKYFTREFRQQSVLFSFPFHSTYHIFEDFGPDFQFYGKADATDLEDLTSWLAHHYAAGNKVQALWCEIPSNPLTTSPDLQALRRLADQYSFFLIVDDTIGSFCNIDVTSVADVLVTSLTKSFSGYADVMGGSLILNPSLPSYPKLKSILDTHYQNTLYSGDAAVLLSNSDDYLARSTIHNHNGSTLASYFSTLADSPASCIRKVYYPTINPSRPLYDAFLRPTTDEFTPGHGTLLTVEFNEVHQIAAFHDAIDCFKAPHLGAHVTLVLPYTKGLYNDQLEWAGQYDMRETQMRIAPGLEDTDELLNTMKKAMEFAEKAKPGYEKGSREGKDDEVPAEEVAPSIA